jgi:ParB-like chromosome segregation protein Spo0J
MSAGTRTKRAPRAGKNRGEPSAPVAAGMQPPPAEDWVKTLEGKKIPAAELAHIAPALRGFAVAVDSLYRDPNNARAHDEPDLSTTAASLADFGQQHLVHFESSSRIVKVGNGRHEAAEKILKWKWIAAVPSNLDATKLRAFALIDNRTAEKSRWDHDRLADELDALADLDVNLDGLGFADVDMEEIEKSLQNVAAGDDTTDGSSRSQKNSGELQEKWKIVVDCEDAEDQVALLNQFKAEGRKCRALVG